MTRRELLAAAVALAVVTGCQGWTATRPPAPSSGPAGAGDGAVQPSPTGPSGLGPRTSVTVPSANRGLSPETAFVTAIHRHAARRLGPEEARTVLDTVWTVLGQVPSLAPAPGGAGLLASIRLSEQVLDVSVWRPQTLVIGGARIEGVSGLLIPITGAWRYHVLVVRGGDISASPALDDSLPLARLEQTVQAAGPQR